MRVKLYENLIVSGQMYAAQCFKTQHDVFGHPSDQQPVFGVFVKSAIRDPDHPGSKISDVRFIEYFCFRVLFQQIRGKIVFFQGWDHFGFHLVGERQSILDPVLQARLQKYKNVDEFHQAGFNHADIPLLSQFRDDLAGVAEKIQLPVADKGIEELAAMPVSECPDHVLDHKTADLHFRAFQIVALLPVIADLNAAFFQVRLQFSEIGQNCGTAAFERVDKMIERQVIDVYEEQKIHINQPFFFAEEICLFAAGPLQQILQGSLRFRSQKDFFVGRGAESDCRDMFSFQDTVQLFKTVKRLAPGNSGRFFHVFQRRKRSGQQILYQ